jgi:hypothetical protein
MSLSRIFGIKCTACSDGHSKHLAIALCVAFGIHFAACGVCCSCEPDGPVSESVTFDPTNTLEKQLPKDGLVIVPTVNDTGDRCRIICLIPERTFSEMRVWVFWEVESIKTSDDDDSKSLSGLVSTKISSTETRGGRYQMVEFSVPRAALGVNLASIRVSGRGGSPALVSPVFAINFIQSRP